MSNFEIKDVIKNPNQNKEWKKWDLAEWSLKRQNALAKEIKNKLKDLGDQIPVRVVQRGDTLGALSLWLTWKMDYKMEVDYRSKKIDTKRNLTIKDSKKITLMDNPMIYPDQYVWIEDGKMVVSDEVRQEPKKLGPSPSPELKTANPNLKELEEIKKDPKAYFLNFNHSRFKFSEEAISQASAIGGESLTRNNKETIKINSILETNSWLKDFHVFFLWNKNNVDESWKLINPAYFFLIDNDFTKISFWTITHKTNGLNRIFEPSNELFNKTNLNSEKTIKVQINQFLDNIDKNDAK